jgi:hypothetical protein
MGLRYQSDKGRDDYSHGDENRFRTGNLNLAALPFVQNFTLVNLDRVDPANCQFVCRNSFDLEEMVWRFKSKKPIFVDARKFFWKL